MLVFIILCIIIIIAYIYNNKYISKFECNNAFYTYDSNCTGCFGPSCLPGYYKQDNTCLPCKEGNYCNNNISTPCGINETSEPLAVNSSACMCVAGYYGNHGTCQLCPANSYCPNGSTKNIRCFTVFNQTSNPGSTSIADCKCREGEYMNPYTNFCESCPSGFKCSGNNIIELCPMGYYCNNGIGTVCPNNSLSFEGASSIDQCFRGCEFGYYLNNGICTECPSNSYCPDGITKKRCIIGTSDELSTSVTDCTCAANTYMDPVTNNCITLDNILNYYSGYTSYYSLIKDVYKAVSIMSIDGNPEFNMLRIMTPNLINYNDPKQFTPVGTVNTFTPNNPYKGFKCRMINIYKTFLSRFKNVLIKRIILLDVDDKIINYKFHLVIKSGTYYIASEYDVKFQNINEINFIIDTDQSICLLAMDELDILVYKIIIISGEGNNMSEQLGSTSLTIRINNSAMYNNLNLSSWLPSPDEFLGLVLPGGIITSISTLTASELYKYGPDPLKNNIKANKLALENYKKAMSPAFINKILKSDIKISMTIPFVYPVDFDDKRAVFKQDTFDTISFKSIFTIFLQDEFYNLSTELIGLKFIPDPIPD